MSRRTAQELAETAVPHLADFVTVDLPEAVLRGEEPADPHSGLRRTVVHGIRDDCPFSPVGKQVDYGPATPQLRCLSSGQAVLEPDLKAAAGWLGQAPEHTEHLLEHVHSLIAVPLAARGVVLGIVGFYRAEDSDPFADDDRSLAQELATRAALSLDNARRYTREHSMVLALQRSLLPHGLPEQDAVEVAQRYLPAESDIGGDWYDVIPLSGSRIGLFVGDVVGHGMLSAATMGRLRTAARSFAELDFPPDEVLTHLDNLVGRLDREEVASTGIIGATCLYAVYDPTSQQCTMARAGHPPPALVCPDGTVSFPDLPAGPPLGLGGLPFEAAEVHLPEDSQLVLYTDGLIEDRHRDVGAVLDQLRESLAHPGRAPEETCQAILDTVAPARPCDDIALLVARTRVLDPHRIATWDLPADPALVSEVRAARHPAAGRLGARRGRVRRGTDAQRAGHQCHTPRPGAHPGTPPPWPHPDLRGLRHQQHRPAPAPGGQHRRGRPWPVPRRSAVTELGYALHAGGQGHLGRMRARRLLRTEHALREARPSAP